MSTHEEGPVGRVELARRSDERETTLLLARQAARRACPAPRSARTKKSCPSVASRTACVATARTRRAPCASTTSRYSASTSSVRATPSASRRPVRSVERPRRVVTTRRSSVTEPRPNEQPGGVRAAVDGRDRHGERGHRRAYASSRSWPATQRPTGSSPPARKPGVVGVEALHALPRAADAARWARARRDRRGSPRRARRRSAACAAASSSRSTARLCRPHAPARLRAGSPRLTRPRPTSQ